MFHTFLAWQVYEDIYKSAWLCRNDAIAMRRESKQKTTVEGTEVPRHKQEGRAAAGSLHRGSWARPRIKTRDTELYKKICRTRTYLTCPRCTLPIVCPESQQGMASKWQNRIAAHLRKLGAFCADAAASAD